MILPRSKFDESSSRDRDTDKNIDRTGALKMGRIGRYSLSGLQIWKLIKMKARDRELWKIITRNAEEGRDAQQARHTPGLLVNYY